MKTSQRTDIIDDVSVDYTSPAYDMEQMLNFSVQLIADSAVTADVALEVSNNAFEPPFGNQMYEIESPDAKWDPMPGSAVTITADTTLMLSYDTGQLGARYVRLVYTATSGSGAASLRWFAKGRI